MIEGASFGTVKLLGRPIKSKIEGVTVTDAENNLVLLKVRAINTKPILSAKLSIVEKLFISQVIEREWRHTFIPY